MNFAIRNHHWKQSCQSVNYMIKKWTAAVNFKDNYNAHTLRNIREYIQWTKYGMGFEIVCKWFNHSSPAVTMWFPGIEDKEFHSTLMNEIGYQNKLSKTSGISSRRLFSEPRFVFFNIPTGIWIVVNYNRNNQLYAYKFFAFAMNRYFGWFLIKKSEWIIRAITVENSISDCSGKWNMT